MTSIATAYVSVWNRAVAPNLRTVELKAFLLAKDYELSKRFYHDIGFSRRRTQTASPTSNSASCCSAPLLAATKFPWEAPRGAPHDATWRLEAGADLRVKDQLRPREHPLAGCSEGRAGATLPGG